MCGVCGCGNTTGAAGGHHQHDHHHHNEHAHGHAHEHHHHDHDHHHHDHEGRPHDDHARARLVRVERDILEKNDRFARDNRQTFSRHRVLALNLVSSPGAGKTTLLVATLKALLATRPIAVIEGDQQTRLDADRIAATGAPALQINTGRMCHLDAKMISDAWEDLPLPKEGVLFIENVGNLVCPAGFDLGEAAKVVLVSVTEGEDKPLKYPDMFRAARLVLVTKTDLLPHLEFDVARLEDNVHRIHPGAEVLRLSTRSGEGLAAWNAWIDARCRETRGEATTETATP